MLVLIPVIQNHTYVFNSNIYRHKMGLYRRQYNQYYFILNTDTLNKFGAQYSLSVISPSQILEFADRFLSVCVLIFVY